MAQAEAMTILQIWFGLMPDSIRVSMLTTQEWAKRRGHNYVLIGNDCANVFDVDFMDAFVYASIHPEIMRVLPILDLSNERTRYVVLSDIIRFRFLANHIPAMYLDGDCIPIREDIDTSVVCNGCGSYGAAKDNFILIARTSEPFISLYDGLIAQIEKYGIADISDQHVVLNQNTAAKTINIIPETYYNHERGGTRG